MDVEDGDSGVTLMRNGEMTAAGRAERRVIDLAGGSMEVPQSLPPHNRRPSAARPIPATPNLRLALSWVASTQSSRGRAATCRCCNTQFDKGELRLAKESDFASGSGRHFHLSGIPAGLRAHDTVQESRQMIQM